MKAKGGRKEERKEGKREGRNKRKLEANGY